MYKLISCFQFQGSMSPSTRETMCVFLLQLPDEWFQRSSKVETFSLIKDQRSFLHSYKQILSFTKKQEH
jgi:hypothetical protein